MDLTLTVDVVYSQKVLLQALLGTEDYGSDSMRTLEKLTLPSNQHSGNISCTMQKIDALKLC